MKDEPIIEITPEDFEDLGFPSSALSRSLDALLEHARNGNYRFAPWMPVVGMTGSGKTAITKGWLKYKKLKNLYISGVRAMSEIEVEYFEDIPSEPQVRIVSGDELNDLLSPKKKKVNVLFTSEEIDSVDDQTVIVIDDYDRAAEEVRKELFKLIKYHQVVDPRADNGDKVRILKPLMLVVIVDEFNLDELSGEELKLFGY